MVKFLYAKETRRDNQITKAERRTIPYSMGIAKAKIVRTYTKDEVILDLLQYWYQYMLSEEEYGKTDINNTNKNKYKNAVATKVHNLKRKYNVILVSILIIPLISSVLLLIFPEATKLIEICIAIANIIASIVGILYNTFYLKEHNQWNNFATLLITIDSKIDKTYTSEEYEKLMEKCKDIIFGKYDALTALQTK